jgi:hypothetical protein
MQNAQIFDGFGHFSFEGESINRSIKPLDAPSKKAFCTRQKAFFY